MTVIIPVYNRIKYLAHAIQSVLGQSHPAIQVIVVDDGSPIDPLPVVSLYGDRVVLFRKPNGGVASARNAGLRRATGDYVLFLDEDDYLEPDAVAGLVEAIERPPGAAWAAGRFVYVDGAGNRSDGRAFLQLESGDIYPRMILDCLISCPSTVLVRPDAVREAGLFDEDLSPSDDYDLWLTISRDHPIAATPQTVTNYRVHPEQTSRTQWARHYETQLHLLDKHRQRARAGCEGIFDHAIAKVHFEYGDSLYVDGDFKAARRHWRLGAPGNNRRARSRIVCRTVKSYLPIRMLETLRAMLRFGRTLVNR